jgi:putative toxin-antitoxin system antitoxin component (TIGR02293 family)
MVKEQSAVYGNAADRVAQIAALKSGLPIAAFDRLQESLGVPAAELAEVTHIAPRTLARRKREGRLQVDESERLLRVTLLFNRAVEVLGGAEAARQWFHGPRTALGGATPLAYADTEPGAREVEDLLGRIEHGVYS